MTPQLLAHCLDYHTGGEPFRIVPAPNITIPGTTVADRRARITPGDPVDRLRAALCSEPRGHADMYGGFIVPSDDDGADFGVLFWHKDGFSTACGHGSIALGAWAVDHGVVPAPHTGTVTVRIDVPSGRISAHVDVVAGRARGVTFHNVPSYLIAQQVPVTTSRGVVAVSLAYGGAIYAHLHAPDVGLSVDPDNYQQLIAFGREVKWALNDSGYAAHPTDPRLSGVYGTIIFQDSPLPAAGVAGQARLAQRNITVFADGQVDRSPCGSGSSSRYAALVAQGRLRVGEVLSHSSLIGTHFLVTGSAGHEADTVLPQVQGTAFQYGQSTFMHDPRDELYPGFVLR